MVIAFVNGLRRTPEPGLIGQCPVCKSRMIPKCGSIRAWHWSHYGERHCDPWWEETEWHIAWKNRFPLDWREVVHFGQDDAIHIADVKTGSDFILEFQHSQISDIERQSREDFYKSMVWIVDGLRRKRDWKSFTKARHIISRQPLVFSGFESECALLRDWVGRPVDVVFDFGLREEDIAVFGRPVLWQLHPDPQRRVLLTPIYTDAFIDLMHKGGKLQRVFFKPAPQPRLTLPPLGPKRLYVSGVQQYARWGQRKRPRF